MLGIMDPHKAKEGADGAEPHVPGADLIMPPGFQVQQESHDTLVGQLFHRQLAGIGLFPRHKLHQQT